MCITARPPPQQELWAWRRSPLQTGPLVYLNRANTPSLPCRPLGRTSLEGMFSDHSLQTAPYCLLQNCPTRPSSGKASASSQVRCVRPHKGQLPVGFVRTVATDK